MLNWGIVGPKGPPADIVKMLNAAGNKAFCRDKDLRQKMPDQGNEIAGGTPEQFAALIKAEMPKWGARSSRTPRSSRNDPWLPLVCCIASNGG